MTRWRDARAGRPAYYAIAGGRRVFVEQTVRSCRAQGIVGSEFQASVGGVRVGEFPSLDDAQRAALHAAETKTAPQDVPRGRDGLEFDY